MNSKKDIILKYEPSKIPKELNGLKSRQIFIEAKDYYEKLLNKENFNEFELGRKHKYLLLKLHQSSNIPNSIYLLLYNEIKELRSNQSGSNIQNQIKSDNNKVQINFLYGRLVADSNSLRKFAQKLLDASNGEVESIYMTNEYEDENEILIITNQIEIDDEIYVVKESIKNKILNVGCVLLVIAVLILIIFSIFNLIFDLI